MLEPILCKYSQLMMMVDRKNIVQFTSHHIIENTVDNPIIYSSHYYKQVS